jgi:Flp pilus assembly protein TadG
MKKTCFSSRESRITQGGAVAVEFALGLLAFMVLVLGALQAMTYAYQLGMAGLATEQGARAAAMCVMRASNSTSAMHGRALQVMQGYLPGLKSSDVTVTLQPSTCSSTGTACEVVTVSVVSTASSGYQVPAWAPFAVPMPLPAAALRTSRLLEMPVSTAC